MQNIIEKWNKIDVWNDIETIGDLIREINEIGDVDEDIPICLCSQNKIKMVLEKSGNKRRLSLVPGE